MPINAALVLAIFTQTPAPQPFRPRPAAVNPPATFYEPKAGDAASLAVQPGAPGGPRSFLL